MYDYRREMVSDILEWLKENESFHEWKDNRDELEERLYDDLWCDDSITGNGSGSYWFNSWKAEEALCHNLELLGEALTEFGCEPSYLAEHGAESADVTIRCYLLCETIHDALDEWYNEYEDDSI